MRLASIDVGTNTVLLLVAEAANGEVQPLYQESRVIRLGRGVDATGILSDAAMQDGLAVLREYVQIAQAWGVQEVLACGTSALREARNAADFLDRVHRELGLVIRVISGEEEAALSYLGAISNKPDLAEPILMIDIGGGSTELCWGDRRKMRGRLSMDIGSVRLTERFLHHDPVLPQEVTAVRESIQQHWQAIAQRIPPLPNGSAVGVAGTVTTLAAMHLRMTRYDSEQIDGSVLHKDDLEHMIADLARKTIEERKSIPGLHPKRADVILAGALILDTLMANLRRETIVVSDRGLRFGMVLDYLNKQKGSMA